MKLSNEPFISLITKVEEKLNAISSDVISNVEDIRICLATIKKGKSLDMQIIQKLVTWLNMEN